MNFVCVYVCVCVCVRFLGLGIENFNRFQLSSVNRFWKTINRQKIVQVFALVPIRTCPGAVSGTVVGGERAMWSKQLKLKTLKR